MHRPGRRGGGDTSICFLGQGIEQKPELSDLPLLQ